MFKNNQLDILILIAIMYFIYYIWINNKNGRTIFI
jgi:hypothetical protein